MSFLQTLSTNDVVAQYVAAYKAIDGYTRGIEDAAQPGDGSVYPNWQKAQAALSQGKQAALGWVNGVAVRAKESPASITDWDPELGALIADLKLQAKPPIADAAKQMIAIDAKHIVDILSQKTGQFSGLVTGLSSLADALSKSDGEIGRCENDIGADIRSFRSARAILFGNLQAEESKVCPSNSTIVELREEISKLVNYERAAGDWNSVLSQVFDLAKEAVPSARFLQGFWQEIGKGVGQAIDAAKRLPQDAATVLSLDLEYIQKSWTTLQQEMHKITQQLS